MFISSFLLACLAALPNPGSGVEKPIDYDNTVGATNQYECENEHFHFVPTQVEP